MVEDPYKQVGCNHHSPYSFLPLRSGWICRNLGSLRFCKPASFCSFPCCRCSIPEEDKEGQQDDVHPNVLHVGSNSSCFDPACLGQHQELRQGFNLRNGTEPPYCLCRSSFGSCHHRCGQLLQEALWKRREQLILNLVILIRDRT